MKNTTLLALVFALLFSSITYSQCDIVETITVCDMTVLDGDNDGTPDGVINLYQAYNALPGVTPISIADGIWFDPNFNFALDEMTGDLFVWDLDDSSQTITDYQFVLIDDTSNCPNDIVITVNFVLGPFSGEAVPPIDVNDVNVQVCDIGVDPCDSSAMFDLYQALLSLPSAHSNGIWSYEGSSPNFIEIQDNRFLIADIPYQPGPPLIDQETFELIYTVPGITPCATDQETRIKVSVIREVFSGFGNRYNICETEIIAGNFDDDIDLRDDAYLVNEDIEGTWVVDATGQISNPGDSTINLSEIYNDLVQNNPRFGCNTYNFTYEVESRALVCSDSSTDVTFTLLESLRPFSQQDAPPEFCSLNTIGNINLYDLLTFTTEAGVLFDYPNDTCTNWTLISGPSNLGLVSNTGSLCSVTEDPDYTALGTINLDDIPNSQAGTYVFEFTVLPEYNCNANLPGLIYNPPFGCDSNVGPVNTCALETAQVTIIINPTNYAGEDTAGLEFCESDLANPLNLISLLGTNGTDTIFEGDGTLWIDNDTGVIIDNPFTLPEINGQQTFSFVYTTTTENGCTDRANLSFTVYEQFESGENTAIDVCTNDTSFNLFDVLNGNPNNTGTWTGPNGFTTTDNNAIFNPATSESGAYIYTVPDNVLCIGNSSTVTVSIFQSPNPGDDVETTLCRSDLQIDLLSILDNAAASGGVFIDVDNTGVLIGSIVDVSQLSEGTYNFQYEVQGDTVCAPSTSIITINVLDLQAPTANNQTFCASDGATVSDLEVNDAVTINWYDTLNATTPLSLDTGLIDGEDYFVAAIDINGCESERTQITVTVLPFNDSNCNDCIPDGVSNNGDGENDNLDLCGLPETYPNFEIQIFNRYGTVVYKGNRNTELFNGTSNVGAGIGNNLPSGVYFYIFDPRDGVTDPFQDNFYLSK